MSNNQNIYRKVTCALISFCVIISSLTGCASADKTAVTETAENFLSVVASGTTENIEQYASSSVTGSDFVKLFDSEYLKETFINGFQADELDENTSSKLEEFCSLFSNMVTGYEVSKVNVESGKKATVTATMTTAFPIDVIESDEATGKIALYAESYYTEKEDEISKLYEELGEEDAQKKIYNDMILVVIDTYETIIEDSSPETYAIALTLEKNTETDTWLVTNVQDYDSAVSGSTITATDTATTAESISSTSSDASSESTSK